MAVTTTQDRIAYAGDNVSTVLAVPFEFFQTTDLLVFKQQISTGVSASLALGVDYTTTGAGSPSGGSIITTVPIVSGWTYTILLSPVLTQQSNYPSNSTFPSLTAQNDFDRHMQISQRLQDQIARSVRAPDADVSPGMLLPTAAVRANGALVFDSSGNAVIGVPVAGTVSIGTLAPILGLSPIAAESGVAVVNLQYPPGTVDRYGTNTTPGTTSMAAAFQAAISVALAASGSGQAGIPVRFLAGAYNISAQPTFGSVTANIIPIDIGGVGIGTQLIINFSTAGGLFNMIGKNGWYLHDFLMCGNTANANDGIVVNQTGSAEAIEWSIERVTSLVAGRGFVLNNTNNGRIVKCRHWPGNNPPLIVPQTVSNSSIGHGIDMGGSFCHAIDIIDFECPTDANYNAGNRSIRCLSSFSYGCLIEMPLVQTLSGLGNEVGIEYNCSGQASLTMTSVYNEGTNILLANVDQSTIAGLVDGGTGGALVLSNAVRENTFTGINQGIIDIADTASWGNVFSGVSLHGPQAWVSTTAYITGDYVLSGGIFYKCILGNTNQVPPNATYWTVFSATGLNDATEGANLSAQPNQFFGCALVGYGSGVRSLGKQWRRLLTYAHAMAPDSYLADVFEVRVPDNFNFNIAAPINPRNGDLVKFVIRNEVGGAMGAAPTFAGAAIPGWTSPANTFHRVFAVYWSSDFSAWKYDSVGQVDLPN